VKVFFHNSFPYRTFGIPKVRKALQAARYRSPFNLVSLAEPWDRHGKRQLKLGDFFFFPTAHLHLACSLCYYNVLAILSDSLC
jgi:hypothetical protein